ncbi:MAG: MFS transporter, partial [Armatimonadota bacterium]
ISIFCGLMLFAITNNYTTAVAAMFVMGIGGGMSQGNAMALVADLYKGKKQTSACNFSQAFFGVGAILSPIIVGSFIKYNVNWKYAFFLVALVSLLSACIIFKALSMKYEVPVLDVKKSKSWLSLIVDKKVIILCVTIALYVGAEVGQANWLATYFEQDLSATSSFAASSIAFFWAGTSFGRLAGAWAAKYLNEVKLISIAFIISAFVQQFLILINFPIQAALLTFMLGVFLGPIYPTIVSYAGKLYPTQSGTVFGIVVAAGALGGAIFPPAIGWLADFEGMRKALFLCVLLLAGGLVIISFLRKQTSKIEV